MDLNKIWNDVGQQEPVLDRDQIMHHLGEKSPGVLSKLLRNLKLKFWYVVISILSFAVLQFFNIPLIVHVLTIFLMVCYTVGGVFLWREHRELQYRLDYNQNILTNIRQFVTRFENILRSELIVFIFTAPTSAFAGFVLGYSIGGDMDKLFSTPRILLIGFASAISIAVIGYFIGKAMNNQAFGKYISRLKADIRMLENEGVSY